MSRLRSRILAGVALLALAAGPGVVFAQYDIQVKQSTDGTPVPDEDKDGVNPGTVPNPNDNGCWAFTAANILGAAGWGKGANAAAKAHNIYLDLVGQFETVAGDNYLQRAGDAPAAAKWWVHNIGLNMAYEGQGYSPTNDYVNFRRIQRTLFEPDYNMLLDELTRCQYVAVDFAKLGVDEAVGHVMTLVSGNYGPRGPVVPPNLQLSAWHNSDSDAGPAANPDEETYTNRWGVNWEWFLDMGIPGNPNDDWIAEGAFLACPGVPKPASAIGNFDVHRYIGLSPQNFIVANGTEIYQTEVQQLTTGTNYGTYTGPTGSVDPEWDGTANLPTLVLPNQIVDDYYKKLYILVDFNDPVAPADGVEVGAADVPAIQVFDDNDIEILLDSYEWAKTPAGAGEQVLLTYIFDDQPAWEKVVFPSNEYVNLMGQMGYNVYEWNLATECVPEPATLALAAVGLAGFLLRRLRG